MQDLIIKAKSKEELRNLIQKNKDKRIIVEGYDDLVNRAAVEDKRVFMLLNPEIARIKDFKDWRNSGMNDVVCKLAAQNNILIGVDLDNLPENEFARAERLGRIMQNIRFCRKFNAKIMLLSKKLNESELRSIALVLGMSTKQAQESIKNKG